TPDANGVTQLTTTSEFNGDELPQFKFSFKSKRGILSHAFNAVTGRGNKFSVSRVRLVREDGTEENVPVGVDYGADGEWQMQIKNLPRSFRAGKYTAHISMQDGPSSFDETVEFYWGVLVLNIDKSSYRPGESVLLQMGALDDAGSTICNANLRLT